MCRASKPTPSRTGCWSAAPAHERCAAIRATGRHNSTIANAPVSTTNLSAHPIAPVRFNLFKLLGVLFLLLTLFIAWRTRRDIASGETQWGRALFQRSTPLRRSESPLRYWLATLLNVLVVLLFALAAVFILRVGVLRLAGR